MLAQKIKECFCFSIYGLSPLPVISAHYDCIMQLIVCDFMCSVL